MPTAPPGERFVYSDINFFLLGDIVRRVSGERLDQYAKAQIFDPLGMKDTTFLPPESLRPRIAPTERCRPLAWPCVAPGDESVPFLRGIVHDPTARRMDGVAGHAGLFSTAADLSRFCRMLLGGGRLGADADPVAGHGRADDVAVDARRHAGGARARLGHRLVVLRESRRAVSDRIVRAHRLHRHVAVARSARRGATSIFLSNRVHPDGKGDVTALRGKVATVAAAALMTAR